MTRQEDAVREFEAAVGDLLTTVDSISDAEWHGVAPATGWTRAATVMHVAMGNDTAAAWMAFLISHREILDTPEFHDRINNEAADRYQHVSKAEAMATLQRSAERTAHFLRSLTDDEIDRLTRHGVADRDLTAGQFMPNFARHVRLHTKQLTDA
jgi:DinB superfamily